MVATILSFVTGVGLLQCQALLPGNDVLGWLLIGALALMATLRAWRPPRLLRAVVIALVALALGFGWAAMRAQMRIADELPPQWEVRDIRVAGVVALLPQAFDRGVRFEFDVERVLTPAAIVPRHILVSWYGAWRRDEAQAALPSVRVGERWELTLRLRRPHGTANPHGFDFEGALMERGLRATGYVRPSAPPRRLDAFVARPGYAIERVREAIRARVQSVLEGKEYAGVIAALVMGDQRAIPPAQWQIFTRTGVNHLMSISGLHVTMIGSLLFALAHALWRRGARLSLRLPARRAAVVAGFLGALCYAGIAGFAVPAQRTVYMLGVMGLALWLGQVSSASCVLALALLLVVVLDPWAVLAPGFWLSFGAVAVILYASVGPLRPPHWLIVWARTQWAITIGLVPLLLALFQQVSLVSPLANAVAIPAVSLAVVPLALLGSLLPFDALLHAAHALMALTMLGLEAMAAVPDGVWQQHAPPPWTVVAACCGIFWMLLPRGFPCRWIGAGALAPLFLVLPPAPDVGAVRVTVLDVGQGLAVVVQTHEHALLYDAGPMYAPDADSGSRIVVPFLRAAGIRHLDGMIVSHEDNDHVGGAASVLAALPVAWLASSLSPGHTLHASVRISIPCFAGQRWQWDGVTFEMLHPRAEHESLRMKANDRSCVLSVATAYARMLLTGDIEARSEREILQTGHALEAQILIVPHHGSTTSSTDAFVAAVHPGTAIVSAGYRNRFGHPRAEVLARYRALGSNVLRSDRDGALMLDLEQAGIHVTRAREIRRRYWQDPP